MSTPLDAFRSLLAESWRALGRRLTVGSLERRLRKAAGKRAYEPEPGSLLYVAASALPYHTSGYTTRTHEVLRALMAAGGRVQAMTRPGYPADRPDRLCDAEGSETQVGDVRYRHAAAPANNRPVLLYALQAAPVIAAVAAKHRVAAIHAASNHVNALPALLAARRLGIAFQYEMRGLWELTRISRQSAFAGSQAFRQGLQLEGLVARHADRLFVISEQLGRYARARWGLDPERMALLPNCVDADRFVPADPREVEADMIGYAGSLMGYEGLDTLIDAVEILVRQGSPVKARLIGEGEAGARLKAMAERPGLSGRIDFSGRMPPEEARKALCRCALVCIPRKPFEVCRIVPPIKLVEALAMAKPVIVPDLPVFRDEMGANPAGWFFEAGNAADLARVIEDALSDRERLAALGERARAHALKERRWRDFVTHVLPARQGESDGR